MERWPLGAVYTGAPVVAWYLPSSGLLQSSQAGCDPAPGVVVRVSVLVSVMVVGKARGGGG